jgi:hypothetical protein
MPETWRLCLSGDGAAPTVRFFADGDKAPPDCGSIGRQVADHAGMRFEKLDKAQLPRANGQLYISESHGAALNRLLADRARQPTVRVRISKTGRVTPVDILLDGHPYRALAVPQR